MVLATATIVISVAVHRHRSILWQRRAAAVCVDTTQWVHVRDDDDDDAGGTWPLIRPYHTEMRRHHVRQRQGSLYHVDHTVGEP